MRHEGVGRATQDRIDVAHVAHVALLRAGHPGLIGEDLLISLLIYIALSERNRPKVNFFLLIKIPSMVSDRGG